MILLDDQRSVLENLGRSEGLDTLLARRVPLDPSTTPCAGLGTRYFEDPETDAAEESQEVVAESSCRRGPSRSSSHEAKHSSALPRLIQTLSCSEL